MVFYTADLHFGHANIIALDQRPFESIDEMDEELVRRWNKKVREDDTVYFLGDFCFRSKKQPWEYAERLNGKKVLIVGNHEKKLIRDTRAMRCFESVHDILTINDGNRSIVLCHYPLAEWPGYFHGAYHIYGHIHANTGNPVYSYISRFERAYNAGCMINNYEPVTFAELVRNNRIFHAKIRRKK